MPDSLTAFFMRFLRVLLTLGLVVMTMNIIFHRS